MLLCGEKYWHNFRACYSIRILLPYGSLKCEHGGVIFRFSSCYFLLPGRMMFQLLTGVLEEGKMERGPVIAGSDFKCSIGGMQPGDSVGCIGCCGFGARNGRGVANWVAQNGFKSWTCEGFFDDRPISLRKQRCQGYGITTCWPLTWTIVVCRDGMEGVEI